MGLSREILILLHWNKRGVDQLALMPAYQRRLISTIAFRFLGMDVIAKMAKYSSACVKRPLKNIHNKDLDNNW